MRVTFCSPPLLLLFAITFEVSLLAGGSLDNDIVKNWSAHVEGYLLKLAEEGLKTRELQKLYDSANYTVEEKSGFDTINSVKSRLGNYFVKKENTARVSFSFYWQLKLYYVYVNLFASSFRSLVLNPLVTACTIFKSRSKRKLTKTIVTYAELLLVLKRVLLFFRR